MQPNRYGANAIEISPEANIKAEGARQAWGMLRKTFHHWVVVGDFVVAMRARAEELGGRKTFQRLLEQQGLGALVKAKAITSRLEKIMAHLPKVEEWYRGLSEKQQLEWSSPSSVIRHCPIFATKENKAQGKTKPTPNTAITLTKEVDRLEARNHKLEEENELLREKLKSAQARIRELESGKTTLPPVKAKTNKTKQKQKARRLHEMANQILSPLLQEARTKKAEADGKAVLQWKLTSQNVIAGENCASYKASTAKGRYGVDAAMGMSGKFDGYEVSFYPPGYKRKATSLGIVSMSFENASIAHRIKTADEAKAIAQDHYDKLRP